MKFYGDATLQLGSAIVASQESTLPESPTVGRIVFVNKRVWIAVELVGGVPTWVPLTNEISTYVHNQLTTSAVWTVTHNLNTTTPLVQVYDDQYKLFIPNEVTPLSNNQVQITLDAATAGRAVVMFGDSTTGLSKSAVAYTHTQTTLSSTWVVTHGLGYYPIVRVFVGSQEIQPASIVHDSIFQTTITFSEGKTGYARFA